MRVAQDDLPFGGVGASGMGAYHEVEGFRTLSHHLLDRGRGSAAGRADASIVERDHLMLRRETINNSRVPVVQDGSQ